jgi:hypothetical protein
MVTKAMAKKTVGISFLFLSILWANNAFALQKVIKVGDLKIIPSLVYSVSYQQNIYLDDENEVNDVIHRITPALDIEWGKRIGTKPYVRMDYQLGLSAYQENDENNFQDHQFNLELGYRPKKQGFYTTLDNRFIYTADPYGTENQYNLGVKTRRWKYTPHFTIGYDLKRWGAAVDYENETHRFDEETDQWQNRIIHNIGLTLFYHLSPKFSLFGNYSYEIEQYDEQNDGFGPWNDSNSMDSNSNIINVGFRYKPVSKLVGTFEVGWEDRNYENDRNVYGMEYEDEQSWVAGTNLWYQFRPRTRFRFKLIRSFRSVPDFDATSYIITTTGLGVDQRLPYDFVLNVGFDWSKNEYLNERDGIPDKNFDTYIARAGLIFPVYKWISMAINYEYRKRIASDDVYEDEEYEDNIFYFKIRSNLSI